jgi:hypothetical protein
MADLKIITESLPMRCEVCHQSDCFDALTNSCSRCHNLSIEVREPIIPIKPHRNINAAAIINNDIDTAFAIKWSGVYVFSFAIPFFLSLISNYYHYYRYNLIFLDGIGFLWLFVLPIIGIIALKKAWQFFWYQTNDICPSYITYLTFIFGCLSIIGLFFQLMLLLFAFVPSR